MLRDELCAATTRPPTYRFQRFRKIEPMPETGVDTHLMSGNRVGDDEG